MRLEGLHHVTAITGDAQRNLNFYVGTLGLRFVKKTVNFDAPGVYHLYYGDDVGAPGSAMTFFEFPDVGPGRAGAGMVHTVAWRVAGQDALDYWDARLEGAGVVVKRAEDRLRFSDPEGLSLEIVAVSGIDDAPLIAHGPQVPPRHALQGFHGVRAYAAAPERSGRLLDALGFQPAPAAMRASGPGAGAESADDGSWWLVGDERSAVYQQDPAPGRGMPGAGTIHHIAWAARNDEHELWRAAALRAGAHPTQAIDRTYFQSIYFREPAGVLFEIATLAPGFTVDEPAEELGHHLQLPPQHEERRAELERTLAPLLDPWID